MISIIRFNHGVTTFAGIDHQRGGASEGINRITLYITYPAPIVAPVARAASVVDSPEVLHDRSLLGSGSKPYFFAHFLMLFGADEW